MICFEAMIVEQGSALARSVKLRGVYPIGQSEFPADCLKGQDIMNTEERMNQSNGKASELLRGLNEDLAAEWGTIMRYTYQSSKAVGLRGAELREIFAKEIPDELGHATYLSDVISDLGGEPTTEPRDWDKTTDLKAMLELDLKMEEGDVENYTRHAKLAEELGLTELKVKLEEMAADESRHARELHRILKGM
jgi:bacterioferritin